MLAIPEMTYRTPVVRVVDVDDEAPVFSEDSISGATRADMDMTTTLTVMQEETEKNVIIVQLEEVWSDVDSRERDLRFDVDGEDDLPSWIKVHGPDEWEDIFDRYDDVDPDGEYVPTGLRDSDMVVVIVVDRTAATGENESTTGASFSLKARDGVGSNANSATETIMIDIDEMNVNPADPTKVVSISGGDPNDDDEVTGTGNLMMTFNSALDPNIAGGKAPYLVLYTWSVTSDDADDGDAANGPENVDIISVSSTPQPLMLGTRGADGTVTRNTDYVGQTITAKVEVFEFDAGDDGKITMAQSYMATVEVADAATAPVTPTPTTVSFGDITTDTTGVVVTITATGEAAEAGTARLQSSTNGTSGWINVDSAPADTSTTPADVTLDVDANGDGTTTGGDGGGLYYRVVYVYEGEDGDVNDPADDMMAYSEVIQLGSVATDPADITLIVPAAPTTLASGDTVRVNNLTANVEVQWQAGMDTDTSGNIEADEWMDLAGETGLELTLTDDHAGHSVRALLTHKGDEDNPSYVTWVDYSAVAAVDALPVVPNKTPTRTQETYWLEVNLNSDDDEGTATD